MIPLILMLWLALGVCGLLIILNGQDKVSVGDLPALSLVMVLGPIGLACGLADLVERHGHMVLWKRKK